MAEEMFKTTLMGGFDKDDVQTKVQIMKDEAFAEKSKLIKEGKEKDKKIADLQRQLNLKNIQREQAIEEIRKEHEHEREEMLQRLRLKEEQKEKLEREISEKYKKYIDRYDLIGSLVLEAQEKAEKIVADAEQKRDMLVEEAQREAQKCLDAVQSEVDEKLAEGKRKYIAVQEEMYEIVELINQAQRRFMSSYREVHKIISTMPESMRELEDETENGVEHLAEEAELSETENTTLMSEEQKIEEIVDSDSEQPEPDPDDTAEPVQEEELNTDSQDNLDEEDDILETDILRLLEREENEED